MDARLLLTVVLGVLLGLFFLAAPATVVRIQTAGRASSRRRGPYGADGTPPAWTLWLVRGLGVLCLAAAAYFYLR